MLRIGPFRWRPLRQRLIDSINELTGTDDCQDAVLIHQRPRWAWMLLAGTYLLVLLFGAVIRAPVYLVAPVLSMVVVFSLNVPGQRWVLARSGSSVLLAESPSLWPRATRVVDVVAAPLDEPHRGRRFNRSSMVLFGRRVFVPLGSAHLVPRIID